VTLALNS